MIQLDAHAWTLENVPNMSAWAFSSCRGEARTIKRTNELKIDQLKLECDEVLGMIIGRRCCL